MSSGDDQTGADDRPSINGGSLDIVGASSFRSRSADESKVAIVAIDTLRPSQGAVGMREVAIKAAHVIELAPKPEKLAKFLMKEALPVARGPGGGLHLVDHHHLGRALWDAGHRNVHVETIADLSALTPAAFWAEMDKRLWLHAFDARGIFVGPQNLPRHLNDMGDDVYRSLAGAIRDSGGFTKTGTPFAEFKWADFLRALIPLHFAEQDFAGAVIEALKLARSPAASRLPGFVGN